jgi:hypothetical protein
MPATNGNHSFECEIQIDTGALAPDRITFRVRDTTDYDTLKYLVVDTSDYGLDSAAYPAWDRLLYEAQTTTRLSVPAGDPVDLYALLFDVNRTPGGLPPHPKLLGTDYADWEIHLGATHAVLDTQARSYSYTNLTAWVSDTIIVTYPQQTVTPVFDPAEYPMPPSIPILSDTVIIDWRPGSGVRMYLYYNNDRVTGAPIPMDSSLDTITVYARLFDQFDNPLLPAEPDVMLWSISASDPLMTDSLTVPSGATHVGTIIKLHEPDSTEYRVVCTLPPHPRRCRRGIS